MSIRDFCRSTCERGQIGISKNSGEAIRSTELGKDTGNIYDELAVIATQCPFINSSPAPYDLIVDFLFVPPPDVDIYM